ncbi:MAG: threonine-phosphate decarboxylase CobD [Pseudomonadota bacterium]
MSRDVLLHGGALDLLRERFPDAPAPWLDLSTGINPWPYPYRSDVRAVAAHLPTREQSDACASAMATSMQASAEHLILAPGTELLIRLLPAVLDATRVCVAARSYGDHFASWQSSDAHVIEAEDPLQYVSDCDTLVVCNPNNPDGRRWSRADILNAREQLAAKGGRVIVDEAYADLEPERSLVDEAPAPGLIVLRSFGKFFGLAGVRLGALIASDDVLDALRTLLGVWPVAGPALSIGAEAYRDASWQHEMRQRLAQQRGDLDAVLESNGLSIDGGTDLFRFIKTANAADCWEALAKQGIYTRLFRWSSCHLRIGLPSSEREIERLDAALRLLRA